MRRAFLLAALLGLGGCHSRLRLAPGEQGEVIEAEGWAPIDAADPLGTERRALADAQKKAVERVAGVFISAKTRVDQTINIDERILAKVDGYVRKYDVLGKKKEDGFLKIRIKAVVLYKKLGDDLKSLGLTKPPPPPGNPRVAFSIRTRGLPDDSQGGQAAHGLGAALLAHGFTIVDGGDPAGDDLLIQGEAEVHPYEDERLGGLHSERARLEVEVLKSKSAEVIANKSQEASGLDISADVAAGKALNKAGNLVGEALAKELLPQLKAQLGVAVKVDGLGGLDMVGKFVDDIRMNPEVEAATLSDYHDGLAVIQVTTEGIPGDELSALILRSPKFHLSATAVTAYAIDLKAQ